MDNNTCIHSFIFGTQLYGKYNICILNHLNLGCKGVEVCRTSLM